MGADLMPVEDWARREGQRYATGGIYDERGQAHADGIVHAFSALLSDEAVEAAAKAHAFAPGGVYSNYSMRAALQAAVRAATEGESNE